MAESNKDVLVVNRKITLRERLAMKLLGKRDKLLVLLPGAEPKLIAIKTAD